MSEGRIALDRRGVLAAAGAGVVAGLGGSAAAKGRVPAAIAFAVREIAAAAKAASVAAPAVAFEIDPALGAQCYRIGGSASSLRITGGDAAGAMYGGLEVADALRLALDHPATLPDDRVRAPHVAHRGIKFNIPLDLRTPSYSDGSTSARANIPEVWSREFWAGYFDEMARNRFNVLSLWSLHPFPSMVKVPEFPDVALDDVWRSKEPLGPAVFNTQGKNAVPPRFLANHEVVKTITIDAKIAFWREVMQMAADRGIDVYIFTWNLFVYGAEGKHGITDSMTNPATTAYFRASVRELVKTYPLLAGIGITAGENLPSTHPEVTPERWLWRTYGEGVRDALGDKPRRKFRLIHRFHDTRAGEIEENWNRYPGWPESFTYSYKYSVAHMYSSTRPPFIAEAESYISPRLKTWLTVRNDDIYSFRWGDPDFAREYILNMPAKAVLAGFYMGPDGYCWGRDFLDRATAGQALGGSRPLVMQKQWYSFAIWGRLAFDPTLSDGYFAAMLQARFGDAAGALYDAMAAASKIVPQVTRFFWKDIDLEWLPEACSNSNNPSGTPAFYTVADFMNGATMPGSGILSIRRWRWKLAQGVALGRIAPHECASALEGWADTALRLAGTLHGGSDRELGQTLGDIEAMAHLGSYYAGKIRGACDLALFDRSRRRSEQASAIAHLEAARNAWRRYAAVRDGQYVPNFLNRIGWVDITALTAKAEDDIAIARGWTPGTLKFDPDAAETHWAKTLPEWTIND